jgi:signal peptidase I
MGVLIFFLISYILLSVSLFFLFPKAGEEGWKGLVPGLNFITWCKIIGQKSSHAAWLLFPIVNIFTLAGMCVDMARSFNKFSFADAAMSVIYAPAYFFKLAFGDDKYAGPAITLEKEHYAAIDAATAAGKSREVKKLQANSPYKKGPMREWAEAIIFAVFAAAFIRMFLIEAYVIPTGSMEGSLLVGDYLFVSKAHYGIRTPQTVAMFPLLHNRLPFGDAESYLESPTLPYYRLPAIETIDNNDPIVFNYPEGDSVYIFPERTYSIYDYRRKAMGARAAEVASGKAELVTRPVDKMDHYVKRCIAVAGDSLEIRNQQVFINGKAAQNPSNIQFSYYVTVPGGVHMLGQNVFDDLDIEYDARYQKVNNNSIVVSLSKAKIEELRKLAPNIVIEDANKKLNRKVDVFPHDPKISGNWNRDNFGPIWIPKAGVTVDLTPDNIALFRRLISVYEGNDLVEKNGKFIINGEETTKYTIKLNYYWGMGDNRHNSEDSRVWGYIPETHIVGKPWFIWFSTKDGNIGKGINWSRLFSGATKM